MNMLYYYQVLCQGGDILESEILSILKEMQTDIRSLKEDVSTLKEDVLTLKEGQSRIESKLDGVVDQTADLTEFRTEMNMKLDSLKDIEDITKTNCYDIAKLRSIK